MGHQISVSVPRSPEKNHQRALPADYGICDYTLGITSLRMTELAAWNSHAGESWPPGSNPVIPWYHRFILKKLMRGRIRGYPSYGRMLPLLSYIW